MTGIQKNQKGIELIHWTAKNPETQDTGMLGYRLRDEAWTWTRRRKLGAWHRRHPRSRTPWTPGSRPRSRRRRYRWCRASGAWRNPCRSGNSSYQSTGSPTPSAGGTSCWVWSRRWWLLHTLRSGISTDFAQVLQRLIDSWERLQRQMWFLRIFCLFYGHGFNILRVWWVRF